MEDEKSFSDICGGRVVLRRRYYSPYCREFGLSSARLSLRSLTAVTCAVWLAAYGLFTLCEVKAGARPSQAAALKRADPWVRAGVWGLWAWDAVPWLDCSPSLGGCPAHPQSVLPRRTVSGCSSSVHASLPTIGRVPQNSRKGFLQTQLCTCVCAGGAHYFFLISAFPGHVNRLPLPTLPQFKYTFLSSPPHPAPDMVSLSMELTL